MDNLTASKNDNYGMQVSDTRRSPRLAKIANYLSRRERRVVALQKKLQRRSVSQVIFGTDTAIKSFIPAEATQSIHILRSAVSMPINTLSRRTNIHKSEIKLIDMGIAAPTLQAHKKIMMIINKVKQRRKVWC